MYLNHSESIPCMVAHAREYIKMRHRIMTAACAKVRDGSGANLIPSVAYRIYRMPTAFQHFLI